MFVVYKQFSQWYFIIAAQMDLDSKYTYFYECSPKVEYTNILGILI